MVRKYSVTVERTQRAELELDAARFKEMFGEEPDALELSSREPFNDSDHGIKDGLLDDDFATESVAYFLLERS